ncbi:9256_t:CDS:1, partial [Racocetra fulgida]
QIAQQSNNANKTEKERRIRLKREADKHRRENEIVEEREAQLKKQRKAAAQ